MGNRKITRFGAITAAAVVLPLAIDAQATAAPSEVKRYSAVSVDGVQAEKQVQADCPTGTRLVGGGGHINDRGSGKVMLTQLFPHSHEAIVNTYYVTARNIDPSFTGNWSVEAYAICAAGQATPGGLVTYQLPTEREPSTFKAGKVECPKGQRVVSAGASTRGSSAPAGLQLVRASGALDIARGTARVPQADIRDWTLHTLAVCANPIPGVRVVSELVNTAERVISCPEGTKVYGAGGGGSLTDSGKAFLRTVYVSPDLRRVHVAMTAVPVGGMVVQAICVPTQ